MFAPTVRRQIGAAQRYALLGTRRGLSVEANREAFLQPVENHLGVVSLRLNRPQKKNSISIQLLQDFRDCIERTRDDAQARVLVVASSTAGSFCAGADLAERRTMSNLQVLKFLSDLRSALGALENLPIPTIAAIDGPALGGGLELGLACDIRIAGQSVTNIGLPETRLGIIPGAGGTQRLTRLLGVSRTKSLIFTGKIMDANKALEKGVVDFVSAEGKTAFDEAVELADEMVGSAPLALRAAKLAISRAPESGLEAGLDFENACYQPLLKSSDRLEALAAFKEKRSPVFTGE